MRAGNVNYQGMHSVLVLSRQQSDLFDLPNPVTHVFTKSNGAVVKPLSQQVDSPPGTDPVKVPLKCEHASSDSPNGTTLGILHWIYEGPEHSDDLINIGEYEVYVNLTFHGVR